MLAEKLILDIDRVMYENEKREQKLILDIDRVMYERDIMAEKLAEKKISEIAKNLLSMGMTAEQIKNVTNLPLNKIKSLQKQK